MVEDALIDAELVSRVLRKAGIEHVTQRVDSEDDFLSALSAFGPDIILSDHSMPHMDGSRALALAQQHAPSTPFVFVSGTIGEEVAIESLKRGATDYIIKSNMSRLPAAVQRALQDARERAIKERAEQALREAQERFALFMQHLPGPAFIKDTEGRLQFVNAAFARVAKMDASALIGKTDHELWPEQAAAYVANDRWVAENARALETFESVPGEHGVHTYLVNKFPIPQPGGDGLIGGVAVDLTARLLAEEKLARLGRIHAFMSGINSAIVRAQAKEELLNEACRIAVDHGGFRSAWIAEVGDGAQARIVASSLADREAAVLNVGRGREARIVADAVAQRRAVVLDAPGGDAAGVGAYAIAGLPISLDDSVTAVLALYAGERRFFEQDEMRLLGELAGDISFALEYLARKEQLDYFAYYDPLTGLANRALCTDRINQAVQTHTNTAFKAAVLVLDLERFSFVNDSFGRQAGDELLRQVGRRLQEVVAPGGTVARVADDAFALVFTEMREDADVARLVEERVAARMSEPFDVNGQELRIAFKCGVALYPGDGRDAESLLRNAETALKNAKVSAERYLFYAAPMNARVAEILTLENALRRALAEDRFVLHYQPKLDLASNRLCGLEALVRWDSEDRGLVPPAVFLPIVEETGMILDLGMWVMRQAARDQRQWRDAVPGGVRVSVNVSALQLRQRRFVEDALQAVRDAGGDPASLDLEITESVIMENIEQSIPKLRALRTMGMGVEIDDFGTGYSSLAYLGKLPATALKIDKSFVTAMTQTSGDRTIISAIISLAHLLNLAVIAEGVETVAQRDLLRAMGCDRMQGYLFGKPRPAAEIAGLLERSARNASLSRADG
jgi:diguanylate cyclase (GGDEF)-like protein/PAS domain S-box-containing protein